MKKWLKENKKNLVIASIVLCVLLVTLPILRQVFDNTILPYLSMVENNSWSTQLMLLLLICLIYAYSCVKYNRLHDGCKIISSYIIWTNVFLILYLKCRLTYRTDYIFYGLECLPICYSDACVILIVLIEIILVFLRFKNKITKESKDNQSVKFQSFLPDVPSNTDFMRRENYVEGLLNKILVSVKNGVTKNHSFTILLNEKYGAGKTTFMLNLRDQIKSNEAYVIDFKPWLCPSSQQMITELLNQFVENKIPIRKQLFAKYAQALASESSWIGVVSRFMLNSTSTPLSKQFDNIADEMKSLKKPVIVLVDDVDRLSEDELMELIKLIRNTAAFPNTFYVVAADKRYLSTSLANKGIKEPDLFLQKFFNFEMTFPKDDFCLDDMLKSKLLELVDDQDLVSKFVNKECVKYIIQTPRDIYRYCNLLSFEMDLFKQSETMSEINVMDLMLLTLLHYFSDEIYKVLREHDALVLKKKFGHLTLNEYFEDIIHKRYAEMMENVAAHTMGVKPAPRNKCDSFSEAIDKTIPSNEERIALVLTELFPSTITNAKYSISNVANYYKYFSGKIARNEMMEAEVYEIIELPSDEFRNRFNKICVEGKFNSFKLRLDDYSKTNGLHSLSILQNLAHVWTQMKCMHDNPNGLLKSFDIFAIDMKFIILNVFTQKVNSKNDVSQKIIKEWFHTECNFEFLVLTLDTLRDDTFNVDIHMIISNEQKQAYSNHVIKRFIHEHMSKAPFMDNVVEQYYNFGRLLWYPQLKIYIQSLTVEQRQQWVYRVVINKNGIWSWNKNLIKGITAHHGYCLNIYFDDLGIKFDDELHSEMMKVSINLSVEEQQNNRFVQFVIALHKQYFHVLEN